MAETFFLGIDVSTTSSKALLVDSRGAIVAQASHPHTLQSPRPLWSEQDPHEWWDAASKSIREVAAMSHKIAAIGLTGQMHGLVLLDAAGEVLRPAILWNDQRTQAECEQIHGRVGRERFISITGNVALTGFTAPKVLWVRSNEPHVYAQVKHILLPKDYVRFRLTGEYAMDKADGAGTVLFDLKERDWSNEVLEALQIDLAWLPKTFEGPEATGKLSAQAAKALGLPEGIPVIAGGGDQAAQAVGVGAVEPGIVALTLGTSGVIFATTPRPYIEPEGRLHAFCHSVPGAWHLMGVMLSAAGSLQWYRDSLAPGTSFDDLVAEAEAVPPGAEGLLFLPYLSGERTPHPDPLARGAFVGLTLRHGREHLTRAILEGVAFGLKDSFELMRGAGLAKIHQVRASGGGVRSQLWRQVLASVLNVEIVTVNANEGAAYGAALLAGVNLGVWSSVAEACKAVVTTSGSTLPDKAAAQKYRHLYGVYRDLYPALKPSFHKLSHEQ